MRKRPEKVDFQAAFDTLVSWYSETHLGDITFKDVHREVRLEDAQ
jgi:hypothetical protein